MHEARLALILACTHVICMKRQSITNDRGELVTHNQNRSLNVLAREPLNASSSLAQTEHSLFTSTTEMRFVTGRDAATAAFQLESRLRVNTTSHHVRELISSFRRIPFLIVIIVLLLCMAAIFFYCKHMASQSQSSYGARQPRFEKPVEGKARRTAKPVDRVEALMKKHPSLRATDTAYTEGR